MFNIDKGSVHQILRSRRSVRRFCNRPVPDDVLQRILETALWAPSAHNCQPWRFVILKTLSSMDLLAKGMSQVFEKDLAIDGKSEATIRELVDRSYRRICDAPLGIVVCLDVANADTYLDEHRQSLEHHMAVQSVAMAGLSLMLAIHAEGLGAVWMCAPLFAPCVVRVTLALPDNWEPQGLILAGYPAKLPEPRQRKSISDVALFVDGNEQPINREE